ICASTFTPGGYFGKSPEIRFLVFPPAHWTLYEIFSPIELPAPPALKGDATSDPVRIPGFPTAFLSPPGNPSDEDAGASRWTSAIPFLSPGTAIGLSLASNFFVGFELTISSEGRVFCRVGRSTPTPVATTPA